MRKPVVIRICGCLLAFLMVFSVLAVTASAVPKYVSLDGSAVEDDLETLIGKEELDKLILDETVSDDDGGQFLSVIRLLEFGYDARQENWDYYGLYLYIYNPSGKPLVSTTKNCVEMQVGMYNGERTDVVKYPLKLLSFSSDYTLYKYEITGLRMGVLRQMNLSQREYHIAGMELQFSGQSNPKDYDISMSYIFSGFNAGFDSMRSSIDTLRWRYEQLETIAVELHPTSWMSDTSDRGEGYRYEVSGVYFAIPNYYLKTYGNWDGDEELHGLYAVSGSYRESRINGIVTDSEAVYTAAQQVAGKSIKWYGYDQHDTADIRERNGVIYRDDFPLHFYWDLYWNEPGVDDYRVRASYNIPAEIGGFWDQVIVQSDRTLDKICIPFHSASDEAIPADVVSQALAEYSGVDYRNTDVDDGRTYGNQVYTVTADDPPMGFTKYDYSQDHPFLAWLLNGGTKNDKQAEVEWLQRIDLEFLESVGWTDTTTIAEKYYIGEGDVAGLRELCNSSAVQTALTAGIKGATVYMMHFARTDYFSTSVQCFASGDITETEYPGNHYYYERTVFEDFDILQFTFKRENGELTKIPVVASPVNITGGLPAPSDPDGNPSNPGTEDPGPGELIAGCAETFGGLNGWGKLVVLLLGVVLIALLFGPLAKLLSPLFGLIGKAIGELFDSELFLDYNAMVLQWIYRICLLFSMLLPLALLLKLLIQEIIFSRNNRKTGCLSRPLRLFLKLERKAVYPVVNGIRNFFRFFFEHKCYKTLFLVMWLLNTNVISIGLEAIAFYYWFLIAATVPGVLLQLVKLFIDLLICWFSLPLPVWLVLFWLVFDRLRRKKGYEVLAHQEAKNCGFLKSTGFISMVVGAPGVGKTAFVTDAGLSWVNIYRAESRELIAEDLLTFPEFPFLSFHEDLRREIAENRVYNLPTAELFARAVWRRFEGSRSPDDLYGYDYARFGLLRSMGNRMETLENTLREHAKAYFVYICENPSLSNYPIRFDGRFDGSPFFPEWQGDFFESTPEESGERSVYSHILDQDLMRMGKTVRRGNPRAGTFGFGIYTNTEWAKSRGNSLTLQGVDKTATEANQKNDLYEYAHKMCRHASTMVRGKVFFRFLADEQRPRSLGVDLRDLASVLSIESKSELKLAMPHFVLGEMLYDWFYEPLLRLCFRWMNLRGDETLFSYLCLKKPLSLLSLHYRRIYNVFGTYELDIRKEAGTSYGDTPEQTAAEHHTYYLMVKKIYADRYNSDCYEDFFAKRQADCGEGINDLPTYAGLGMTVDEMELQNDYFLMQLMRVFADEHEEAPPAGKVTPEEPEQEDEIVFEEL